MAKCLRGNCAARRAEGGGPTATGTDHNVITPPRIADAYAREYARSVQDPVAFWGEVERHEVPNLRALNFLLHESLDEADEALVRAPGGGGRSHLAVDRLHHHRIRCWAM